MQKYKIGDTVKVAKERTNLMNAMGGMDKYLGKFVTITNVGGGTYSILEDSGGWTWHDEMFIEKTNKPSQNKGDKIMSKEMLKSMGVKKVIFNGSTTIVFLDDDTKGVAQCGKMDSNDPLVGFSVAYANAKATSGNKRQFKDNIDYMVKKAKNGKFEIK